MIDALENEDAFYVYRGQDLVRQSGYYIYYDKNPMMREYLAERKEGMQESENYEKMMENMRDERLIRQFREKVSRKTKSSQRKGRFRTFSTAAAVVVMMIMGGSMYYYAQQDQSINFRDVVNGAVNTMGKGVKDQVEDKSETTKEKTVTKILDTQASTENKKNTTKVKKTTEKSTAATSVKKTNVSKYKYYKYTVKKGETLVSISRKVYGTQKLVQRIKTANTLNDQNQIYPGQKLIIPVLR